MYIKTNAIVITLSAITWPLSLLAQDRATAPAAEVAQPSAETTSIEKKPKIDVTPQPADSTAALSNSTTQAPVKRVTGIGGVFIKAKDPAKLRAWYKTHLGIDVQTWGGTSFRWTDSTGTPIKGKTAWLIGDGANFAPSEAPFMVNYRVADLLGLVKLLREEGCHVLDKVEQSDFGIFGWVMGPEGNKIELWQPPAGQ